MRTCNHYRPAMGRWLFLGILTACVTSGCAGSPKLKRVAHQISKVQLSGLGDAAEQAQKNDILKTQADDISQEAILGNVSKFYEINPAYASLAKALSEARFSAAIYDLEVSKLNSQAHFQKRLPQTYPEMTVNQDGQAVGRMVFEQLLIGNGSLRAQKLNLSAQESQALAEYRIEANDDLAKGFSAYLNMSRNQKLSQEAASIVTLYQSFLDKAEARVKGGVANRNEFRLFELKTAQIKAQELEFRAQYQRYKAELMSLTDGFYPQQDMPAIRMSETSGPDSQPQLQNIHLVPQYQLQLALLDQSLAQTLEEKAARRPQLALSGSFGSGNVLALGSDNDVNTASLGLKVSKPLYWGGNNLNILAMETEEKAAKAQAQKELKSISTELQVLDALIESYRAQLDAKLTVAQLADQRAKSFENDFKAGAVSIVEAVSILETVKSVKLDYIEMGFSLIGAELTKAQTLGVLGPVP